MKELGMIYDGFDKNGSLPFARKFTELYFSNNGPTGQYAVMHRLGVELLNTTLTGARMSLEALAPPIVGRLWKLRE